VSQLVSKMFKITYSYKTILVILAVFTLPIVFFDCHHTLEGWRVHLDL
jgi:hypothetical protein